MQACITGGSGFIGTHLAAALQRAGDDVVVMDKIRPSFETRLELQDLAKQCSLPSCDTLFHYAAAADVKQSMENPAECIENNITATHNVLEACRKQDIRKIIFASTSTVYGNAKTIPTPEESELNPISVYGATKAACELLIKSYSLAYGIDAVVLRYANIYGPGSRRGVVQDFVAKLAKNPAVLEVLGDGMQSKSYLYIDDAIEATLLAVQQKGWDVFNVGSETQMTVKEIAQLVISCMGLQGVEIKYAGGNAGWPGDVPKFLLDVRKIKALGWREIVAMREGIRKYIEWARGNGHDRQ